MSLTPTLSPAAADVLRRMEAQDRTLKRSEVDAVTKELLENNHDPVMRFVLLHLLAINSRN